MSFRLPQNAESLGRCVGVASPEVLPQFCGVSAGVGNWDGRALTK